MPSKVVDLSARSRIIRDEPWHLHFWESTPEEALPSCANLASSWVRWESNCHPDCRIETVITIMDSNHQS